MGEKERLTRRFTEEVLNIIGPRVDVMAPDMGTDEQTMAWIYDTYSMKVGYACPEIVTGKPVELGGCVGRKEATGRGVVYCIREALDELRIRPNEATAVVQGFGNVGSVTCEELIKLGVKIVAVGDRYGAIRNDRGHRHRGAHRARNTPTRTNASTIVGFPGAEEIDSEGFADHALHGPRPRGAGTRHHRREREQAEVPHPRRRGERPDDAGCRRRSSRGPTSSSSRTSSATRAASRCRTSSGCRTSNSSCGARSR